MGPIGSFVALPRPPVPRAALVQARRALESEAWADRVRWVPDANLHVTLQFLGDVPRERIETIRAAIAAVCSDTPPVHTKLVHVSAFPSATRARVIVAELAEAAEAASGVPALAAKLGLALTPLGHAPEARRFRPHVTLGRVRRPPLRGARVARTLEPLSVEIGEVVLFRSTPGAASPKYEPLAVLPLSGGAARLATQKSSEKPTSSR